MQSAASNKSASRRIAEHVADEREESFFARFADRLAIVSGYVAGIAVLAICLLVVTEVGMRTFFNRSTLIADEMCGYLNVCVVFFGLIYALRKQGFVRVDALYRRLRGRAKIAADWYNVIASFTYVSILLFYLTKYVLYSYQTKMISQDYSETELFIPQSVVVIGLAFALIYIGRLMTRLYREGTPSERGER